MGITKIADGAYFVPSYSVQTITRAYSNGDSGLFFGGAAPEEDDLPAYEPEPVREAPAPAVKQEPK
ncbi:hypothetical protein [Mesorhizobium sp.]|uniref:hypothetical protein n=1 Tax=Mesorhizobium sp. TaxID=1871066 RepID=UPI000FE61D2C|nr:hypothetical protein [Mesorhizobium sp.]RWD60331.1 MAG: hypothetical protein EOS37_33865 [Mesorhizobium sp.]TIV50978.1 MAG: hypothetical protein E5V80_36085 [Mesorhizobium sp.]